MSRTPEGKLKKQRVKCQALCPLLLALSRYGRRQKGYSIAIQLLTEPNCFCFRSIVTTYAPLAPMRRVGL